MAIKRFEDLVAWQRAITLAEKVHGLIRSSDIAKDRVLADQLWRATVSVASNISEGFERYSRVEFARFLSIARGSCGEVRCQLVLAQRVALATRERTTPLLEEANELSKIIGGLRTSVLRPRKD